MNRLKIGIIGCGTISQVHLDSITKDKNAELSMVCDIKEDRAQSVANRYGCNYTTNPNELINEADLDVIHILTPHHTHYELAKEVLNHNKHCLLEKPMCLSSTEAKDLIRITDTKKAVKLGIVFQNRLNTTSQYLRECIDNKTYGKLIGIKCSVTWFRSKEYYQEDKWRGIWKTSGGGVLINQAIHTLDLLQWFAGEIESISGSYGTYLYNDIIEVEDTATMMINFKNNIRGILFATNNNVINSPISMEFVFDKGILELSDSKLFLKHNNKTEYLCEDIAATGKKAYWGLGHEMLISRFYDAIINNTEDYIHAREAAQTIEILEKFYQNANKSNNITVENTKEW